MKAPTIKQLNEWSVLHNMSIKPFNKPTRLRHTHIVGFGMSNEQRHIKRY